MGSYIALNLSQDREVHACQVKSSEIFTKEESFTPDG